MAFKVLDFRTFASSLFLAVPLDLAEPGTLHSVSDVHTEPRPAKYGSGPVLSGADDQAAGTRAG